MNIIESFKLFNEQQKSKKGPYGSADELMEHLDRTCPDWKTSVQEPDCWNDIFEFPIKLFGFGERVRLATILFFFINDRKAEESILENDKVNDAYIYVAARKSLLFDPDGFLEKYKEAIQKYKFSQNWYCSPSTIKKIFDFPGSVEFAVSLCKDEDTRAYALDYLVQVLGKNWEQYPDDIKKEIFEEHEYWLRKLCTQQIWESLSESEKFILAHHIVVNEYNYVHDMLNLYEHLSKGEEFTQPIFTSGILHEVTDIQNLQRRFQNEQVIRYHISTNLTGRFYQPTVDYEKMTYTPSDQLTRFLHFAQASGDTAIAKELDMAKWEIDRSFFDLKRLILRKD